MGEAIYYGKIRFKTNKESDKAFPEIVELIREIYNAGEYWQTNRGQPDKEAFWRGMEENFPKASDYLKSIGAKYGEKGSAFGSDHNNGLAGLLDLIGCEDDADDIRLEDNDISWSSEVWHFADWDPFREYIESKYDCKMHWLSDEYLDIDSLLESEFD